ncbi:MAG: hypothetical protein KatS3mg129_2058 [Leptospiraceae bacterium]|nr:MAG: hypothetical protein KatS3mg129_2058 [Leptospiraceae bacterium]
MGLIFNVIKHHFKDTLFIINQYKILNKKDEKIIKLLNKIGTNQFDVYKGHLTTKEIIQCYKNQNLLNYKHYEYFLCSDNSLWIVKNIKKDDIIKKHLHPARKTFIKFLENDFNINSSLHIRIHSNTYKTLLLFYWYMVTYFHFNNFKSILLYIEDNDLLSFINFIRIKLGLPELNKNQFSIHKFKELFCKFFI